MPVSQISSSLSPPSSSAAGAQAARLKATVAEIAIAAKARFFMAVSFLGNAPLRRVPHGVRNLRGGADDRRRGRAAPSGWAGSPVEEGMRRDARLAREPDGGSPPGAP